MDDNFQDDQWAQTAAQLAARGATVTCAESCTGGMLAARLTDLPGSSAWFEMAFATYSNAAKQQILGVSAETLAQYGAVSAQTVREMAAGARRIARADYALAVSGIAGPGGGSAEKPVGTVWFALAAENGITAEVCRFSGSRAEIRRAAVTYALRMLAKHLQAA